MAKQPSSEQGVVFQCPDCGGSQLEEFCTADVVESLVTKIVLHKDLTGTLCARLDYGPWSLRRGDVNITRYQCVCGHVLKLKDGTVVDTDETMARWFVEQSPG